MARTRSKFVPSGDPAAAAAEPEASHGQAPCDDDTLSPADFGELLVLLSSSSDAYTSRPSLCCSTASSSAAAQPAASGGPGAVALAEAGSLDSMPSLLPETPSPTSCLMESRAAEGVDGAQQRNLPSGSSAGAAPSPAAADAGPAGSQKSPAVRENPSTAASQCLAALPSPHAATACVLEQEVQRLQGELRRTREAHSLELQQQRDAHDVVVVEYEREVNRHARWTRERLASEEREKKRLRSTLQQQEETVAGLRRETADLEGQLEEARARCKVCYDEGPSEMLRLYCGHLLCSGCRRCLPNNACPFCRAPLADAPEPLVVYLL